VVLPSTSSANNIIDHKTEVAAAIWESHINNGATQIQHEIIDGIKDPPPPQSNKANSQSKRQKHSSKRKAVKIMLDSSSLGQFNFAKNFAIPYSS
jgi:hypothetical protein